MYVCVGVSAGQSLTHTVGEKTYECVGRSSLEPSLF